MGGLFGGGTTTQTNKSTNAPWSVQQPYMQEGLSRSHDALTSKIEAGPYQGAYYADRPNFVGTAGQQAVNYAMGSGQGIRDTTALTSVNMMGAQQPFLNTATGLAMGGIGGADPTFRNAVANIAQNGAQSGVSRPLSDALQTAGVAGANALAGASGTLGAVQQRAMADPTQQTIQNAGLYANNPAIDAAIKASQSTVDRTLNQETLPGIGRSASLTGNLNSSRAGMAEAMALRDAAEVKGNIEGTMRGQAYQNGLNLSNTQLAQGMNAATGAATAAATTGNQASLGVGGMQQNQGQFDTTARLQAGQGGMQADTTRDLGGAQVQLGATNQLGSAVNTGINAGTAAGNQSAGLYGLASGVGAADQGEAQNVINANRGNYDYQNGGWVDQALAPYWNITGRPLGSETTTQQSVQQPSNVAGSLLGLGMLGLTPFTGGYSFGATPFGSIAKGVGGLFG